MNIFEIEVSSYILFVMSLKWNYTPIHYTKGKEMSIFKVFT